MFMNITVSRAIIRRNIFSMLSRACNFSDFFIKIFIIFYL